MTLMLEYVIFRNQERQWNFQRKLFVLIVEGDAIWVAREPESGWKAEMVVFYRCNDCFDRWDIVIEEDGI